jgi:hypothetical protein
MPVEYINLLIVFFVVSNTSFIDHDDHISKIPQISIVAKLTKIADVTS